jgi:hypothetical protein
MEIAGELSPLNLRHRTDFGVDQLELSKARRVGTDAKLVNVDFPAWMVDSLDREARRLGLTRQSLIKLWLAEKLGRPVAAGVR